ncbi:MAG TPA: recombinase family protein [Alphaproteobacteria bacterium]|nr:recombinase family protein [Alphaproteobacteria bacterium]
MRSHEVIKKRCAIYTRKSTEEGLDQDFNSLDAQREAAEHHIRAQAHEGWVLIPQRYDDGGFSGGSMERPAVRRLIHDIENGLIDVVVVYKIDRLSRSMADFMKFMELFDKRKVSFVSVTQHFNTDTSMGRLTLNILQSFAQFEREMTAERIRDKFAASKRKGMWMGGVPPLGYNVRNRKLEINPQEAEIVQYIFHRYIEMGSTTILVKELAEKGYTTKSWVSRSGKHHKGNSINKSTIYKILCSQIYIGKILHKGTVYEGEHEGIVSKETFDKARAISNNRKPNESPLRCKAAHYILRGIVFDEDGYALTCAAVKKKTKRYRYYVSTQAVKKSYADSDLRTVSATLLENVIVDQMRRLLSRPEWTKKVLANPQWGDISDPQMEEKIIRALENFEQLWDELFPVEQERLVKLLIQRVVVTTTKVSIELRPVGMIGLLHEIMPDVKIEKSRPTKDSPITIEIPIKLRKRSGRKYITAPDGRDLSSYRKPKYQTNMMQAIVRGHQFSDMLDREPDITIKHLAQREMLDHGYVAKTIRMTQLAPDIIEAILNGRQPQAMTLAELMRPFPNCWNTQRVHFGF